VKEQTFVTGRDGGGGKDFREGMWKYRSRKSYLRFEVCRAQEYRTTPKNIVE
jgi:hypothetical protein